MGRRTLPDDKVVNALSIARYNATYHSNLSTALLHSSLFQLGGACSGAAGSPLAQQMLGSAGDVGPLKCILVKTI